MGTTYKSGQIYYHPVWCHYALLQYLCALGKYCLLGYSIESRHEGSVLMDISEGEGKWLYDDAELPDRLRDWVLQPDCLVRVRIADKWGSEAPYGEG